MGMLKNRATAAQTIITCALLILSACSSTNKQSEVKIAPTKFASNPRFLLEAQRIVSPFAHVVFCNRYANECRISQTRIEVVLTKDMTNELQELNQRVNAQITPHIDQGPDTWTLAPKLGDCEDYAITKRHILVSHGWPPSALRLAIGTTTDDNAHLALILRTNQGDLVLDNLSDDIMLFRDANVSWSSIQSSFNPHIWYKVLAYT